MDLSKWLIWRHSHGVKTQTVMIVENNPDLRNTPRHAFAERGYITWTCPEPEMAHTIFPVIQPSVVLLDLDAVGEDAMALLDMWKADSPQTKVIVESRIADAARMQTALDHGAVAFYVKPFDLTAIFDLLEGDRQPSPLTVIPFPCQTTNPAVA